MSAGRMPTASLAEFALSRRAPPPRREKDGDITGRIAAVAPPPALDPPPMPPPAPTFEPAPTAMIEPANEPPPRAEEIVVYWERLRRGRPFPNVAEIDRAVVGSGWPDSLIVAFEAGDGGMPRVSRRGANNDSIEYTPMVTDWILSRARHAAKRGIKLDEVQNFPMAGEVSYRLLLLPLAVSSGASECVLCHLCRVA
jgi:hypothetical protein